MSNSRRSPSTGASREAAIPSDPNPAEERARAPQELLDSPKVFITHVHPAGGPFEQFRCWFSTGEKNAEYQQDIYRVAKVLAAVRERKAAGASPIQTAGSMYQADFWDWASKRPQADHKKTEDASDGGRGFLLLSEHSADVYAVNGVGGEHLRSVPDSDPRRVYNNLENLMPFEKDDPITATYPKPWENT